MPAWSETLDEKQIWNLALYVAEQRQGTTILDKRDGISLAIPTGVMVTEQHSFRIEPVTEGLDRRIRQVEPQLQKVDPQHPLQRNRRPTARLAHLRIRCLHRRSQRWPQNNVVHIQQELGASGRVVFPYFSNPVSVVCVIGTVLLRAILHQLWPVNQSLPKE